MNCPNCGAPLKSSETICPYCGVAANGQPSTKNAGPVASMKYVSGTLVIFLSLITSGIYCIYWYFSRKKSLAGLTSQSKFPEAALWAYLGLSIASDIAPAISDMLTFSVVIGFWIVSAYLAFETRSILRAYASKYMNKREAALFVGPSSAMLFFFGVIYLQFQINDMIEAELLKREK